jgi:hypothetical protein
MFFILFHQTGPKPSELYGKYTWKIENFSKITKRELRSNAFEVGNYKWYAAFDKLIGIHGYEHVVTK